MPVGRQRVEFNAHRVFDPRTIVGSSTDVGLSLMRFSVIDDDKHMNHGCGLEVAVGLEYGCGIFEFRKEAAT
jgi:hypothetical protein